MQRHPNLADFKLPARSETGLMHAKCEYVSVVDYSKGFGHTEALTIGDDSRLGSARDIERKGDNAGQSSRNIAR